MPLSGEFRTLVSLETVLAVEPTPDADAIEQVTVRSWRVVTTIDEFWACAGCLHFEIDSALPLADERFAFLAVRGIRTLYAGITDESGSWARDGPA